MNILRIIYDWPDENNITEGLAPAPYELSLSQVKLGHKITVLCGNLNGRNLLKGRFTYTLAGGAIRVYNLPRAFWQFGPFLTTSIFVWPYYILLKLSGNVDIVHNHGHMGVYLLLWKKLFGWFDKIPFYGHFHNCAVAREQAILKQGGKIPPVARFFEYPIHKWSDWMMVRVSEKCVAVSQDIKNELVKFVGANSSKVSVVESGVDIERFTLEGEKADFGFPPKSIIVANGGRLSKRKNIDLLVESLSKLPEEFVLALWGSWDKDMKTKVDEVIVSNNLQQRVKYLGSISYFEVDKYFRASDIFVLPSSYEGLPKVVVEALATGCKVVASGFRMDKTVPDIRFLGEISASSISEAIKYLSEKSSHPESTRKIIEENYSWDSKARQIEKIYDVG